MGQGAEDLDMQWARETSRPIVAEQQGGERVGRIRRLRDDLGIGMYEATRIVAREDLIVDINAASTIDDIKALMLRMVKS
jgi:ribosomal protein L7/L12